MLTADDRARNDQPIFEINKMTIPIILVLLVVNIIVAVRVVLLCSGLQFEPKTKFVAYKGNNNLQVIE